MGMTPLKMTGFRARGLHPGYLKRLGEMQAMVASLDPRRSYVSFSAGKDSAVIAHACHRAHPGIPILMVDPGCPTHWTAEERTVWLAYAAAQGWNLTLFPWEKWGLDLQTENTEEYQARIHRDMFADLSAYAADRGLTCRVMGLRAAESRNRRMSIGRRGSEYVLKDGMTVVLPISIWQTEDVWAYILAAGLPWLTVYDLMGPEARNGLIGRSGEEFGRVEYLKHYYPDVWRWAASRGIF